MRQAVLGQQHPLDLDAGALVIDVIEVHEREEPRVGPPALQVPGEIDAVQLLGEDVARQPARPLVEIAEHDLRPGDAPVVDDAGEPDGLFAALEQRRPEVDVVEVQHVAAADVEIDALRQARLAGLPGQVVLLMVPDGKVAEHDVAEERVAQVPRRRHHPAHAKRRADLRGLPGLERARADDFLQRDDVGLDGGEHGGDALRAASAVETAAPVDVVGDDSERVACLGLGGISLASDIQSGQSKQCTIRIMARLKSELELTCPCCQAVSSSTRTSAASSSTRSRPIPIGPSCPRRQRILAEQAARRDALFEQSVQDEKTRGDALSQRFEEALKQAKQGAGVEAAARIRSRLRLVIS